MHLVAKWTSRKGSAWAIIGATLLLAVVAGLFAAAVEQDDDLLAFLPEGNEDIDTFYAINKRLADWMLRWSGSRARMSSRPSF